MRELEQAASAQQAHEAAEGLFERAPDQSAKQVLSRAQAVVLVVCAVGALVCALLRPGTTLAVAVTVISALFLLATGFKFVFSLTGARFDHAQRVSRAELDLVQDADLPVFTVLVPVFREANIVGQLVGNLGGLDYPADKLEVIILVEEEDDQTRQAVAASQVPDNFRVVVVPAGAPQTKPRACNVGLQVATGEFLVIFDAEDVPEPDQLKKAVLAFRASSDEVVVLQAALSFYNDTENALARMFSLEYGFWFQYMLVGLEHYRLPIPLGGTSNHFRTAALTELGGWDPYNVTEDADLGVRASAQGYRVGVIESVTLEEANTSIPNFVRQRSRWIKGYMQTTLVHLRHPAALMRSLGPRGVIGFLLLIAGTPLTFLTVIPSYALIVAVFTFPHLLDGVMTSWAVWASVFNFLLGEVLMVYVNMLGPFNRGRFHLVVWALLNPAYWLLHSIAAYKALWQLITRPHYWEKTQHGLTSQHHAARVDDRDDGVAIGAQ